jgi:hypothetical protein
MSEVDKNNGSKMNRFEKEFFFLSMDVQTVMYNLLYDMFGGWGTPRRWVKFAKTQWRGSRIQLDSVLPILQILSPSIRVEEIVGLSTGYAPDTFYVIWNTDDFDEEPDLKKFNEIISIRKECDPSISKLLQLL